MRSKYGLIAALTLALDYAAAALACVAPASADSGYPLIRTIAVGE